MAQIKPHFGVPETRREDVIDFLRLSMTEPICHTWELNCSLQSWEEAQPRAPLQFLLQFKEAYMERPSGSGAV